ncbi:carbamoyltransferase HypF [Mangrovimicrobium sediminis]|uniref:Carbamoyltransferase HypF n=1 Tax=Mangrovimicrobium sediminis TaxID=2562682 RepID=A0A4Z0M4E9_9GAMM|nr:carbamoyltransferase HypF [Haliea sp. SAOS-164]
MRGERIRIRGTVQGVGFRPHVWRLARSAGITGDICNDNEGVLINAWGDSQALEEFVEEIETRKPPLAVIESVERQPQPNDIDAPGNFSILDSGAGAPLTAVAADAASCHQCLAEARNPRNRRAGYPFTNCTHCGPRYSIIRAIPYDRANTSMAPFAMCTNCLAEYYEPEDRRFHAQPNACPDCGPQLWLEDVDGNAVGELRNADALARAAALIASGHIVAVKGMGGVHLAVDACNAQAVDTLRERKRRYRKPLALMARDIAEVRRYAYLDWTEAKALHSPAAPIVILRRRDAHDDLAPGIAPGQDQLGFMLPYTPLHLELMRHLRGPIVLTSGNLSEEPQCTDNTDARERLAGIADYLLLHDRDIVNRVDDSVVRVTAGHLRTLRRARGFAPGQLALPPGFEGADGVLATGADLKNTFCLLKDGYAILSPHMGDLEDAPTQVDYRRAIALHRQLYAMEPQLLAADMHPDYHSSHYARELAASADLPCAEIQHHHAHIAAVLGEHGLPRDSAPVLGIALDGLGYGDDGGIWGGEFLLADYAQSQRIGRFRPVPMLGGNLAMREPWRCALAHLWSVDDWESLAGRHAALECIAFLREKPLDTLRQVAAKGINSPPSSSAGRLFDAAAALLGLHREEQAYEGEAAMALEAMALRAVDGVEQAYPFELREAQALVEIDWSTVWPALLEDLAAQVPGETIAARFHTTVATAVAELAQRLMLQHQLKTVALSGGVLQNSLLASQLQARLAAQGHRVLMPEQIPCNDGGIALGQALVAWAQQG